MPHTGRAPRHSISLSQRDGRLLSHRLSESYSPLLSPFVSLLHSLGSSLSSACASIYLLLTLQLIVHPEAPAKRFWDWFLLLSILYNALALPFVIAFTASLASSSTLLLLDVLTTLLMLADMALVCRTAIPDHTHTLVYDAATIRLKYTRSSSFLIDAFSTLPFFLLSFILPTNDYPTFILNTLKLPSVLRVSRMFQSPRIAQATSSPKLRILRFLLWFLYLAHVFACGFFFIGEQQPGGSSMSWIVHKQLVGASVLVQYIASLSWALETMCTVGFGDNTPTTTYEQGYACAVLMATGIVYAAVFGNMTNAIQALSTSARRHHGILDDVHEFSDIYNLPPALHNKLLAYAQQHWNHTKGFELAEVTDPLPLLVKARVLSHINSTLLQRVPLFQHCSPRFLDALILKLHNLVCLPGDYVFREGDMSRDLYFIRYGRVEVVMDDPTAIGEQEVVISEIGAESSHPFFGEIALLLGETRTASVRAKVPTMLSMVSMRHFYEVMSQFSSEEDTLREVAMGRLRGDLLRMQGKQEADAAGKPDKAHALAVMALGMMTQRAQQRLAQMEHEKQKREWKRQKSVLQNVTGLRGINRFRKAVYTVIGRIIDGRRPFSVTRGTAASPVKSPSPPVDSPAPQLIMRVDSAPPAMLHAASSTPVTPHLGVHASPPARSHRLPSYFSQPLVIPPTTRHSLLLSPSRGPGLGGRLSHHSSICASPTGDGTGGGGGDRQAMATVLRSSTLRELKSMVMEKDAAGVGEGVVWSSGVEGEALGMGSARASVVGSPSRRRSYSDKGQLQGLLRMQGSMRDVLAMNGIVSPGGRGSTVGSQPGSREQSRPDSAGEAGGSRAMQLPLRTMTTVGRGGEEGMSARRGAMIEKLHFNRGKTLISPSGALHRQAAAARAAASDASDGSGASTPRAPPALTTGGSASSLSSTWSPSPSTSSVASPYQPPLRTLTVRGEGASPSSARVSKRRTLHNAQELTAMLQTGAAAGTGGGAMGVGAGLGGGLTPRGVSADADELMVLRKAVQGSKRRTMKTGDMAAIGAQLNGVPAAGEGSPASGLTLQGLGFRVSAAVHPIEPDTASGEGLSQPLLSQQTSQSRLRTNGAATALDPAS